MKSKYLLSIMIAFLLLIHNANAQKSGFKKGLLWEISGKDLAKPSYVYGTYHLLNEDYVNSLKGWQEQLDKCNVVVGEVEMDSSSIQKLTFAMMMSGNTLDKLLTPEEFQKTKDFLIDVSGYDLAMFNTLKPMALSTMLTVFAWAKQNPKDYNPQKLTMDMYFQKLAKDANKEVRSLELVEEQATLLFDKISIERQKELLVAMVNDKDKTIKGMNDMDKCYREQDLLCIMESFNSKDLGFKQEEVDLLLSDRNKRWIPKLIAIIEKDPAFISVGAAHLPGKEGVLNLLKKEGYTIKAVELK